MPLYQPVNLMESLMSVNYGAQDWQRHEQPLKYRFPIAYCCCLFVVSTTTTQAGKTPLQCPY
jgi:hypothetical protein